MILPVHFPRCDLTRAHTTPCEALIRDRHEHFRLVRTPEETFPQGYVPSQQLAAESLKANRADVQQLLAIAPARPLRSTSARRGEDSKARQGPEWPPLISVGCAQTRR